MRTSLDRQRLLETATRAAQRALEARAALKGAVGDVRLRELGIAAGHCVACGPTVFVRVRHGPFGTRCARCGAAENTAAVVECIQHRVGSLRSRRVYLTGIRGPLKAWLLREAGELVLSGYDATRPLGETREGVRNEDLERLTFDDASFDLATSTEVLEHVADDHRAFAELHRVLRPGGHLIFAVPIDMEAEHTVERAVLENGVVRHLLPPEYHDDPTHGQVLAFRTYGRDITDRLTGAGFISAELVQGPSLGGLAAGRFVVVAQRA